MKDKAISDMLYAICKSLNEIKERIEVVAMAIEDTPDEIKIENLKKKINP